MTGILLSMYDPVWICYSEVASPVFQTYVFYVSAKKSADQAATLQLRSHGLLLTECEVRTASYGPSFFPLPFMAQTRIARAMKTRKEKDEDP